MEKVDQVAAEIPKINFDDCMGKERFSLMINGFNKGDGISSGQPGGIWLRASDSFILRGPRLNDLLQLLMADNIVQRLVIGQNPSIFINQKNIADDVGIVCRIFS